MLATDFTSLVTAPGSLTPETRVVFEQAMLILSALKAASTQVLVIIVAATLSLFGFAVAITDRVFRSDKVSVLGFHFEASQALREAQDRADIAERTAEALAENIRELQHLDAQLNLLVRAPDADRSFGGPRRAGADGGLHRPPHQPGSQVNKPSTSPTSHRPSWPSC